MPKPIALCIEDCHPASEDRRYLRCCALTGLQPGLALTPGGVVGWRSDEPAAIRLVVSLDEKLVCYRETGAPGGVRVHRGGRFVEVEELKPVVLLDGDELTLGDRRLRLHVHGFTTAAHEPEYFVASVPAARSASAPVARAATVAGLAVAGLLGAAGCDKPPPDKPMEKPPIDVRDHPPAPYHPPMEAVMDPPMDPPPPPMEVRDTPPVALPPEEVAPPPPMEPVMEPVMEPPPIEMRPHPPVKPIPRTDDRPRPRPTTPGDPQP